MISDLLIAKSNKACLDLILLGHSIAFCVAHLFLLLEACAYAVSTTQNAFLFAPFYPCPLLFRIPEEHIF